jgi:hypothetical protein
LLAQRASHNNIIGKLLLVAQAYSLAFAQNDKTQSTAAALRNPTTFPLHKHPIPS